MKNHFNYTTNQIIWISIVTLGLISLFAYGYLMVHRINLPTPITAKEPPAVKMPAEISEKNSLLDLKMERNRERSQEIERLQEFLTKNGLSDEVRKQAEQELWRLTQAGVKEHELENLLKAKGFNEALVTICQKLVTVVIAGKLHADQVSVIGQMASEVTAFDLDQVQIIER